MADAHKNFAYSTVATAPSPATSGTSLVLAAGGGLLMPTVPFNVTVWPKNVLPLASNAEVVRVTLVSTDTLTIVRAQEGTSARSIVVGDQIAATITNKTLTDIEVFALDVNRYGFLNQTETSIAFDGTSVFTLGSVGASWSYYRAGIKHTITGSKTLDLTTVESPLINGRVYYIYIDSTTGTLVGSISTWTLNDTKVPVAIVLWNNTLTPKYWMADERHTCLIDRRTHYHEHFTEGTKAIVLGATSGMIINTDTNVSKTFGIADSTIADEDLITAIAGLSDPDGTATAYTVFYRTGASTWAWKASNMPFVYNVGNTNNIIQYDLNGTMTDVSSLGGGALTRWVNSYVVLTNLTGAARLIIIPGAREYTSLASAQTEAISSLGFAGFPIAEGIVVYRLTWTTVTSTSQGLCRLAALPVQISTSSVSMVGTGSSVDHNSLAGLQGGIATEYYHLSAAQEAQVASLNAVVAARIAMNI